MPPQKLCKPLESDVPHNQPGETEIDAGGRVVPFPGDWLGPEGVVPFGPRARMDEAGEDAAHGADVPVGDQPDRIAGTQTHESPARPGLVAEDFWGGLAD